MPSSLTRVLPRTLEFSSRPPVSVSVRVVCLSLEAFLGSVESISSLLFRVAPHHASAYVSGFAYLHAYTLEHGLPIP